MAVSIQDLIDKRESMQSARKQTYDLETSAGTFTVKKPSRGFIIEAMELDANVTDQYIILNSVVSPNLKDKSLQDAYGCIEPTDILNQLFDSGEIASISKAIMKCAGYGENIKAEVHEEAKN